MTRAAFTMKLKPGFEAEYKRRHDEVWPQLVMEIEAAGISDYSMTGVQTCALPISFQKLKDHNSSPGLPSLDIVKKWWKYMADIMETNPDNSPVMVPLKEVFHMD